MKRPDRYDYWGGVFAVCLTITLLWLYTLDNVPMGTYPVYDCQKTVSIGVEGDMGAPVDGR